MQKILKITVLSLVVLTLLLVKNTEVIAQELEPSYSTEISPLSLPNRDNVVMQQTRVWNQAAFGGTWIGCGNTNGWLPSSSVWATGASRINDRWNGFVRNSSATCFRNISGWIDHWSFFQW